MRRKKQAKDRHPVKQALRDARNKSSGNAKTFQKEPSVPPLLMNHGRKLFMQREITCKINK